jgi:hypothetical protein
MAFSFLVSPKFPWREAIGRWQGPNRAIGITVIAHAQVNVHYGHRYLIGSRGYEFFPADLPLSRSLQNALSEISLCCWR